MERLSALHLARGTNPLWLQRQGGWKRPQTLFDHYAHFIPSELEGNPDLLAAPDGTIRHQRVGAQRRSDHGKKLTPGSSKRSLVSAAGLEPATVGLRVRCSAN